LNMSRMRFSVSVPHGKPGLHTGYGMVKEAAVECERLGYDAIYISDHMVPRPNTPYPEKDEYDLNVPYFECWTVLSALAVETKRVKLGTFTLCNSFRQPPSLLAKMATTLDHISDGRLIFGIGAGYNEKEYIMYGVPYPKKGTRIRQMGEAIQIVGRCGQRIDLVSKAGTTILKTRSATRNQSRNHTRPYSSEAEDVNSLFA